MTAPEMPAAAASRDIAAMKALKSPPHCAAGADFANKTERTNAASRRLIMLKPFFRCSCDNRMGAGVGATTISRRGKAGAFTPVSGHSGGPVDGFFSARSRCGRCNTNPQGQVAGTAKGIALRLVHDYSSTGDVVASQPYGEEHRGRYCLCHQQGVASDCFHCV